MSDYFTCKKVLQIISKKQCTAKHILEKTTIPVTTLYRILNSLLVNKEIVVVSKTKIKNKRSRPPLIYKLKQHNKK